MSCVHELLNRIRYIRKLHWSRAGYYSWHAPTPESWPVTPVRVRHRYPGPGAPH